jgi:dUTP pyrophosphatase
MTVKVKIKKLHPLAQIPEYAHIGDSGADLRSVERVVIPIGEARLICTGIAVDIPLGYEIQVRPRSGMAIKWGISVLNTPGTVDSSYKGEEIKVILINHGRNDYLVDIGDKMAQIVVAPVIAAEFVEEEIVVESERGGFGSTGK